MRLSRVERKTGASYSPSGRAPRPGPRSISSAHSCAASSHGTHKRHRPACFRITPHDDIHRSHLPTHLRAACFTTLTVNRAAWGEGRVRLPVQRRRGGQVAFVMQEFRVRRKGAVAPVAGRDPSQLLVKPPTASIPCEDPQPRSQDAPCPHPVKYRVVCIAGDPSAPMLNSNPEMQELVVTHCGESNDGTSAEHHEAVDLRRGDLLYPSLGDAVTRKRVCILWEHFGKCADCTRLLNSEHLRNVPSVHLAQVSELSGSGHT